MANYKYLLWDIDGTVLDFLAAEKAAIKKLFQEFGFGECTDQMVQEYSKINVKYWQALERNEMTKPEILTGRFREFFESQKINPEFAEEFNSRYQLALGDTIVFCEDAKNLLISEKSEHTLIAITNGTKKAQQKKLKNSGLDKIFDYIFISEDLGVEKPNKEFFEIVMEKAEIKDLSQMLIIGDSLTSDIKGGVNMKIKTCWYNPGEKTNGSDIKPDYTIKSLKELKDII